MSKTILERFRLDGRVVLITGAGRGIAKRSRPRWARWAPKWRLRPSTQGWPSGLLNSQKHKGSALL